MTHSALKNNITVRKGIFHQNINVVFWIEMGSGRGSDAHNHTLDWCAFALDGVKNVSNRTRHF